MLSTKIIISITKQDIKSEQRNDTKQELSPYHQIYQYAKMTNKIAATNGIRKILKTGINIDVFDCTEHHRPVSKLATEGDHEAVEFLRNTFNASNLWIAQGYAEGGFTTHWKKIVDDNPSQKDGLLIEIATGLGRGNKNHGEYRTFLKDNDESLLCRVNYGLAIGGFFEECKDIKDKNNKYKFALHCYELNGAIIGKHRKHYLSMLEESSDHNFISNAAYSLGVSNQTQELETLINNHPEQLSNILSDG